MARRSESVTITAYCGHVPPRSHVRPVFSVDSVTTRMVVGRWMEIANSYDAENATHVPGSLSKVTQGVPRFSDLDLLYSYKTILCLPASSRLSACVRVGCSDRRHDLR